MPDEPRPPRLGTCWRAVPVRSLPPAKPQGEGAAVSEIDTSNRHLVCVGSAGGIGMANPPSPSVSMTPDQALVLAAWLVALADPTPGHERFRRVLEAVESA